MVAAKIGYTTEDISNSVIVRGGAWRTVTSQMQIRQDLSAVYFGFDMISEPLGGTDIDAMAVEGFRKGYSTLRNGIPVLWLLGCAFNEYPLAFCLYFGVDGKLHGYVPYAGNVFDKGKKRAYKNDYDGDEDDEYGDYAEHAFNMENMSSEFIMNVKRLQ